jgi:hypothetical protein
MTGGGDDLRREHDARTRAGRALEGDDRGAIIVDASDDRGAALGGRVHRAGRGRGQGEEASAHRPTMPLRATDGRSRTPPASRVCTLTVRAFLDEDRASSTLGLRNFTLAPAQRPG